MRVRKGRANKSFSQRPVDRCDAEKQPDRAVSIAINESGSNARCDSTVLPRIDEGKRPRSIGYQSE